MTSNAPAGMRYVRGVNLVWHKVNPGASRTYCGKPMPAAPEYAARAPEGMRKCRNCFSPWERQ